MIALRRGRLCAAVLLALLPAAVPALAQDASSTADSSKAKDVGRVTVTGSRIKQTSKVTEAPVAVITRATLDASGATSVGQFLQEMSTSGKALNAKFNSSGNFGYPADGGGIGAGSAQVDLRNLESKRVLVLVDGLRWVNESSASGVSGSADLNTIPLAIVDRIEVLEDGASAIYGSDAIAGVVNIITKKNFSGALAHVKYGSYGHGGDDVEGDITIGGGSDNFRGVLNASYVKSKGISSGAWAQSSFPVPGAGLAAGSSGTPQGRFIFCDPRILVPGTPGYCDAAGNDWFDMTLNNGTTVPNYNGGNPTTGAGTYHNFSGADRFDFAPYNLLLTPSERKSIFAQATYDINDKVSLHGKVLYNQRHSANQAAPEPIFVGPFAGTGGIADGITISASNPYNPFGINLCAVADPLNGCPVANLGFITKRPVELGPRYFTQDVKTWYANFGLNGTLDWGRGMDWNIDYVHSENQADQMFTNGFNVLKLKEALGPAYQDGGGVWHCGTAAVTIPNCVPLNLFGGEGTPITPAMLAFISTPQHDASKQVLDLFTANLTGDLWAVGGDRYAGFAVGYEHRRYQGNFNPDPLRQDGESQDSFAAPISAGYNVNEVYGELRVPWAKSFSTDFAVRYSNYSTFGGTTTGKAGFRWQPVDDLVLRGTYSTGFRAPNLGELYGLTQFGATLVDPCNAVNPGGPPPSQYAAACAAAGVPNGFQQANTQITTFTGGNPALQPEKSRNYNLGGVWSPSWAENQAWSSKLDLEVDYFHYKVSNAIQAPDIQQLLNACYSGTAQGAVCSGFTRGLGSQLNPPKDFLSNLGRIGTSGVDLKANWVGPETGWGQFSASLQSTHAINYRAVDKNGNVAQRAVGIEVNDSAIPAWKTNLQLGWKLGDWSASWNLRYIASVKESCGNAAATPAQGCPTGNGWHRLGSATYSDVQLAWDNAFTAKGLKLSLGANNLFEKQAPACVSCSLNGYDAGTYDLPFRFVYAEVNWKF
ncbi:MAG: TonB-dependent receptor [Proteobacteria bacterium]|nr:TonB-dependent receptor [Pseudomonadota bacterium]MBS0463397.1 TonB-dependent receptor [Pseudomonadota bacterium]